MRKEPERALICRAAGETIVTLRKRKGIAQEKLALDARVERSHMSGIERGKFAPTLMTIYKLLPFLGVSFSEFAVEYERTLRRLLREPKSVSE